MIIRNGTIRWFGITLGLTLILLAPLFAETATKPAAKAAPRTPIACKFGRGQWNPADWIMMRRSDEAGLHAWNQQDHWIENAALTNSQTKANAQNWVYVSMMRKELIRGDMTAAMTVDFQGGLAPSLVLAYDIIYDEQGHPVYRQNVEVVIYKEGVNIWRQQVLDGKTVWTLIVYEKFPLQDKMPYTLEVTRNGKVVEVHVASHTIGYREETLPEEIHVGFAGYEGLNRFYDFSMK